MTDLEQLTHVIESEHSFFAGLKSLELAFPKDHKFHSFIEEQLFEVLDRYYSYLFHKHFVLDPRDLSDCRYRHGYIIDKGYPEAAEILQQMLYESRG